MQLGSIYQHYKGGLYEILQLATCEKTAVQMVVYQNTETKEIWVRPLEEFLQPVNNQQQSRFKLLNCAKEHKIEDEAMAYLIKKIEVRILKLQAFNCIGTASQKQENELTNLEFSLKKARLDIVTEFVTPAYNLIFGALALLKKTKENGK
jgi:thiamine pyrophosphokinase